ncbi:MULTISPECIES: 2-oxo-4-hydroxy-4-carboxy-5-ureidoimidazoline decarboxylase [Oceanimonas]|uniref:2-oxo-4-hydroxy-4-carboxy-5-ureidoimidazoline decarboxylase n=1 Tax=Oceanimonas smirnovii TaxID=264574 RepID=A0ABW7P2Z1_9GAMM|nr:2-oxo-4-hydroxy-4-carboxy-5-ureidoimidazoline decarboxylase [Oceanimonas sp. CAM02]MDV2857013.1 2-oxo-4-hydroxy-4-carboxy-5-ureidoimidazoline decarboxylase [Oceanimonas sp. CAM02]
MSLFKTCKPASMGRDEFVKTFADIYEHSPWVAEQTYDQGLTEADNEIEQLHARMSSVMSNANKQAQLDLINAHPDLAGKAAQRGELTEASTNEQAGAGISECTAEEFERFTFLNNAYKEKFQFPFIMAVKGSNRHQILAAFEERIHNDYDTEFDRAVKEINKIAMFRLSDM